MELVKETKEHSIWKKRSGRHAVKDAKGTLLHGEEKNKILLKEGLIKISAKQPKAEKAEGEKPEGE